jgi:hypothetical protein
MIISNSIGNEDVPVIVFPSSSLIPLHKQPDESSNIPTKRPQYSFYPVRSRKKVAFGSNHTFGIPSKAEMTPDEIQSTWLSRSELKSIKQECIFAVGMIMYGSIASGNTADEYFCSRGLKAHLPRRRYKKSYNRQQLYRAILEEQWYQYQQVGFICNPEEIARKYERVSFKSAMKARRLGLKDQLEASKC